MSLVRRGRENKLLSDIEAAVSTPICKPAQVELPIDEGNSECVHSAPLLNTPLCKYSFRRERKNSWPEVFNDTKTYPEYRNPKAVIVNNNGSEVDCSLEIHNPFLCEVLASVREEKRVVLFKYEYYTGLLRCSKDDLELEEQKDTAMLTGRKRPHSLTGDNEMSVTKSIKLEEQRVADSAMERGKKNQCRFFKAPNEIQSTFFEGFKQQNVFRVFLSPTNPFR